MKTKLLVMCALLLGGTALGVPAAHADPHLRGVKSHGHAQAGHGRAWRGHVRALPPHVRYHDPRVVALRPAYRPQRPAYVYHAYVPRQTDVPMYNEPPPRFPSR